MNEAIIERESQTVAGRRKLLFAALDEGNAIDLFALTGTPPAIRETFPSIEPAYVRVHELLAAGSRYIMLTLADWFVITWDADAQQKEHQELLDEWRAATEGADR